MLLPENMILCQQMERTQGSGHPPGIFSKKNACWSLMDRS
jgi:hypothetical protein